MIPQAFASSPNLLYSGNRSDLSTLTPAHRVRKMTQKKKNETSRNDKLLSFELFHNSPSLSWVRRNADRNPWGRERLWNGETRPRTRGDRAAPGALCEGPPWEGQGGGV